jgi:hypothetical protein
MTSVAAFLIPVGRTSWRRWRCGQSPVSSHGLEFAAAPEYREEIKGYCWGLGRISRPFVGGGRGTRPQHAWKRQVRLWPGREVRL